MIRWIDLSAIAGERHFFDLAREKSTHRQKTYRPGDGYDAGVTGGPRM